MLAENCFFPLFPDANAGEMYMKKRGAGCQTAGLSYAAGGRGGGWGTRSKQPKVPHVGHANGHFSFSLSETRG